MVSDAQVPLTTTVNPCRQLPLFSLQAISPSSAFSQTCSTDYATSLTVSPFFSLTKKNHPNVCPYWIYQCPATTPMRGTGRSSAGNWVWPPHPRLPTVPDHPHPRLTQPSCTCAPLGHCVPANRPTCKTSPLVR